MLQRFWGTTCRRGDDEGVALIVAVALMGMVSVLMVTMISFSLRESRATGRDRQRSSAVTTAEGAVDATMAAIQNVQVANVPCGTPAPTSNNKAAPDTMAVTTTVTYYAATGAPLTCAAIHSGSAQAAEALITSTSTSNALGHGAPAARTISSLVSMKATMSQSAGLDKAIFGNAGISAANKLVVATTSTPSADVYTNGDFDCSNNQSYAGSVFAQGYISMSNTCQVAGDSWAKTGYTSSNPQVSTGGNVLVSQGTASINSGTVGGTVKARAVTPSSFCNPSSKCVIGATATPDPPQQSFPVLNWNATTQAAWAAAGYTNVVTNNNCSMSGAYNGPGQWIASNADSLPGDTVLVTSCTVQIQPNGNNTVSMNHNLAVFAAGGVTISNSVTFQSSASASPRNLYLIQPYNAAPSLPCTTDGITLNNRVSIDATVNVLLYSPCNVTQANNTSLHGQIYSGGNADLNNQLNMYYVPLPVFGVTTSTPNTVASYAVDVLYTREDQS